MKKYKWLALLCVIVLCLTLALAACVIPEGPDNPDDPNNPDNPSNNDPTTPPSNTQVITNNWWKDTGELSFSSSGEVKFPNVTIKLVTVVSGEDVGTFNEIIDEFNDQYKGKIAVTTETIGQANFESQVANRISTNNKAPDLIMSHQKGHQAFADNKLIQPFNKELMTQSKIEISMDDYSSGLAQYTSLGYKDQLFSIPCDAQSMVVYYNKNLLQEIGKELPTNHEELLDVCKTFVEQKGTSPIAWPSANQQNHFYNYVFTTAIIQNGGQLYNNSTKKANWTTEPNKTAFTNAIQSIRDLTDSEGAVKYASFNDKTSDDASRDEFANNRALFYVFFPWRSTSLEEYYQKTNKISSIAEVQDIIGTASIANWFAMDKTNENADKIFVDSHFFAMSKSVEDVTKKVAIMEFVKWFTQRVDVCAKWATTGHVTACKAIGATDEYKNNAACQRYINNFYPNIDNFVCMGLTTHYNTVLTYIKRLGFETLSDPNTNIDSKLSSIQKLFNDEVEMSEW